MRNASSFKAFGFVVFVLALLIASACTEPVGLARQETWLNHSGVEEIRAVGPAGVARDFMRVDSTIRIAL